MAESFDYESTLKALSRVMIPRLADWCAVYLLADDNTIEIADLAGATPELSAQLEKLRGFPFDINGPSISSRVLRTGQSHFISESEGPEVADRAVNSAQAEIVRALNITTGVCVAIRGRDRMLGAISLSMTSNKRRFTEQDLGFIEELARRAAIAIDNARLYREAQQARTEAESAVRLRDEFLSVAAHELRTPVTSLRGFAQTLIRQIDRDNTIDPAQGRRALDTIDKQSIKLSSLVSRLLDISRIEAGRLEIERKPTDVAALAREVVAQA